jgi:hypothetical protein
MSTTNKRKLVIIVSRAVGLKEGKDGKTDFRATVGSTSSAALWQAVTFDKRSWKKSSLDRQTKILIR